MSPRLFSSAVLRYFAKTIVPRIGPVPSLFTIGLEATIIGPVESMTIPVAELFASAWVRNLLVMVKCFSNPFGTI
ncbi:MAG: hypothetical protein ACD_35C00049G0001 [uncultured bacterium]|nr:MAG: hypothetical protein ACD_35C00049G0001 [uncultured bacterium]